MNYAGLQPLSWLYTLIVKIRQEKQKKIPPEKLNVPVISIGNISVGGTGKTEAVVWVCEQLIHMGLKPGILTRGYKRKSKDPVLIVSNGDQVLSTVQQAGDEPYLLARRLAGKAAVVAGKDRSESGREAVGQLGAQVLVLDDGFQRRYEVFRDMDILLLDAGDRTLLKGWTLPAGRCREPLTVLDEADVHIITRSDQYPVDALKAMISQYSDQAKPLYYAKHKPQALINLKNRQTVTLDQLKHKRVVAISGIAGPQAFRKTLEACGADICHHHIYPDHYWYKSQDIQLWEKMAKQYQADIIMTAKDMVKIDWPQHSPIEAWALTITFSLSNDDKMEFTLETMLAKLVKGRDSSL